jgi:hypothetical protein
MNTRRPHLRTSLTTVQTEPFQRGNNLLLAKHISSETISEVVRRKARGRVGCSDYEMAFPEVPTGASFFKQQAKAK